MKKIIALVQAYTTKEDGATAIEYGLIAVAVTVLIVVAFFYNNGVFVRSLGIMFERLSEIIATVIK